ncbi:DUF72 domain-containing protein [Actinokineospora inagensis]|uniref:DUF72 domain-containing protein n=1 Tax=Actinokineospora inagensis TaxID=103730 RepID=UPI00042813E0|nr:DUF72 domain-containing protein [Actinokineospora inagensis]
MIHVGTSGWSYQPWRGDFYPRGTTDELGHLAQRVNTVEVNSTFYGPRKPADYDRWYSAVPDDFVFAVKAPRDITHSRRLRDVATPISDFFSSGVLSLGRKLGPILWQLPASLRYSPSLMADFLPLLPTSVQHALEVRHPSYYDDTFIDQLTTHSVALVIADSPGTWPSLLAHTSTFTYLRLHGDTELYTSPYSDPALDEWASRIRSLHTHGDVYTYFDNTLSGAAPRDAIRLAERLADPQRADDPR